MSRSLRLTAVLAMVAVLVALIVLPADGLSERNETEHTYAEWMNAARRSMGVPRTIWDGDLTAGAQLQAERMAACQCLYHSARGELEWYLGQGWTAVAENVAYAYHPWYAHLAVLNSAPHRAALLDSRYVAHGVAVRQSADGRFWVAEWYGACDCPWAATS